MRKLSKDYRVSYVAKDKDGKDILSYLQGSACYSSLYNTDKFDQIETVILNDFLCEETKIYHKKYIKKLSTIFEVNVKYIDKNSIAITGFKKKLHLKIFLAMFRMLFEVVANYNEDLEFVKKKTINFFEDFINSKTKSPYRCLLKKYMYYYNLNKINQGAGHGLRYDTNYPAPIKSKAELFNYKSDSYTTVHQFFKQD